MGRQRLKPEIRNAIGVLLVRLVLQVAVYEPTNIGVFGHRAAELILGKFSAGECGDEVLVDVEFYVLLANNGGIVTAEALWVHVLAIVEHAHKGEVSWCQVFALDEAFHLVPYFVDVFGEVVADAGKNDCLLLRKAHYLAFERYILGLLQILAVHILLLPESFGRSTHGAFKRPAEGAVVLIPYQQAYLRNRKLGEAQQVSRRLHALLRDKAANGLLQLLFQLAVQVVRRVARYLCQLVERDVLVQVAVDVC